MPHGVHSLNNKPTLSDDRSFRLLELLGENSDISQRHVAKRAGISLGLTNLILKRLITTGHIKVMNLNSRKVSYLLTPKGMQEKANRSYQYLLQTIRTFQDLRSRIDTLVDELLKQGHRSFGIKGESELTNLLELSLKEQGMDDIRIWHYADDQEPDPGVLVLDGRLNRSIGPLGISILSSLLSIGQPSNGAVKGMLVSTHDNTTNAS
jgi:hypothetical protein